MTAKPFHVEITGERRDTETVMRRLEGAIGKVPALVTRWSPTLPQARFCRPAEWVTAPLSLTRCHVGLLNQTPGKGESVRNLRLNQAFSPFLH